MTTSARRAAERWFLDKGLPSVLTRRARWRGLWPRSAPLFTGYATVMVVVLVIYLLTGDAVVDVDGEPTTVEWIVLAVVALALPLAVLAGWLVSRLRSGRARWVAATAAVAIALAAEAVHGGVVDTLSAAVAVVVVPLLTASGIGSMLSWALRLTVSQIAVIGALVVRALPVVLLTVLVFFNAPVWIMASTISRGRLWLALLFLGLIAAAFLVSGTLDRARLILDSPDRAETLTRSERLNVIFVLAASQVVQVLMVAAMTALIFFVLGLILLSPELLAAWTRGGASDGTLLGMTIPVPQALIQISLFLGALTFMYISARAVGDGEYRSHFLDPLIDDLRLTLIARDRYRAEQVDIAHG